MIPHSVQAEDQLIMANDIDNKPMNTDYSNFVVDLHSEPSISTNKNELLSSVSLESRRLTVESRVSHKEREQKISQKHSVYDTNINHIELNYVILSEEVSYFEFDDSEIPELFFENNFFGESERSLEKLYILILQEIRSLWMNVGHVRGPFKGKSKKTPFKPLFHSSVRAAIYRYIKTDIHHEIIRFLLWLDLISTHFREIKVPPSVIFDMDRKGQTKADEDERWKGDILVVPDDRAAQVKLGSCIKIERSLIKEQEEWAEEGQVIPHIWKLMSELIYVAAVEWLTTACQDVSKDVDCGRAVVVKVGKEQDVHVCSSEEGYTTESGTCHVDLFRTDNEADEQDHNVTKLNAPLPAYDEADHARVTDMTNKQTVKTDRYYKKENEQEIGTGGTDKQVFKTDDLLQSETDRNCDPNSVQDVFESSHEELLEKNKDTKGLVDRLHQVFSECTTVINQPDIKAQENIEGFPSGPNVQLQDLEKAADVLNEESLEAGTLLDTYYCRFADSLSYGCSAWSRDMNNPWEMVCLEDDCDFPDDVDEIDEYQWFDQVEADCNIVDDLSISDAYKFNSQLMSKKGRQDKCRVYLFQDPDGATSLNVVEGSATSEDGHGFSSSVLVSCLSLFAFMQEIKKKAPSDVKMPVMKRRGKWTPEKMSMKDITLKVIAWLLIALAVNVATASSPNYQMKALKNAMINSATSKVGALGLKRAEFMNILCDRAFKMLRKAGAPLEDDNDINTLHNYTLRSTFAWKNLGEFKRKDFLRDILNVPDCIQPPQQTLEVYPVFEQRGYEDEFTRLASFSTCPVDNWPPAVTLAENGFYYDPKSSVICNFCKSKSHTWQNDWDPKRKHEPNCSFPNGNIPIEPSRENGKYQPAVELALAELQLPDLHNKVQVLQRNATRSVESFKNPQLPEMGSLSIDVNQSRGQQEHDAMEEEPRPSTSNSTATRQQQEGAGGLRYFVHSYDERGRPISTSQKMEFNSKEEKANTSMKKETDRLKSFANVWKKGDVISPEELAKSGFYYAGTGDRVRCAFCNGVLRNWAVGDHAAAEHRRHYPTCPFVLNLDVGNVPYSPDLSGLHTSTAATTNHAVEKKPAARAPAQQSAQSSVPSFGAAITPSAVPGTILIPKHSNFSTVESRMLTYDNWPTSNVQRPKQLAEAGFFYTGASDNVRCFHCDGGLRNWLDSDMPWVEHAKWFPRCGFLQRAKGVEFVLEETRKHNQQNFTTAVAQNRGSTGMTTTPAPTQGVGIVERPSTGGVRRVEAREVRARFDTDRVKMVLDMGYKEAVVKYVILQRLRYTGDDFPSTQEMLESVLAEEQNLEEKGIGYYENILQQEFGRPMTIVYPQVPQMTGPAGTLDKTAVPSPAPPMTQTTSASLQIPGDEKSLVEENRQLKEQTTCKICMDNEVSMVFVPCGHLVACADCAPNLRQCPICRRAITGTIRTFLS